MGLEKPVRAAMLKVPGQEPGKKKPGFMAPAKLFPPLEETAMETDYRGVIYDLQGNVLIRRYCTTLFDRLVTGGQRGDIRVFSRNSQARMRRYLRCCVAEYRVMLTLTYGREFPTDGRLAQQHLKRFIGAYEYHVNREHELAGINHGKPFSFFWFKEFQKRGAVHFHAFITHPLDFRLIANIWHRIAGAVDDDAHLRAGTRVEWIRGGRAGLIRYAVKYASKLDQKAVPGTFEKVGRFWGVSGCSMTVSASIGWSYKQIMHDPLWNYFSGCLNDLLNNHCKRRYGNVGSRTMVLIIDDEIKDSITALFHRFGLRIMLQDQLQGFFEAPLPGLPSRSMALPSL